MAPLLYDKFQIVSPGKIPNGTEKPELLAMQADRNGSPSSSLAPFPPASKGIAKTFAPPSKTIFYIFSNPHILVPESRTVVEQANSSRRLPLRDTMVVAYCAQRIPGRAVQLPGACE